MEKLTNQQIIRVANELGVEPAALKAVQIVESGNRNGFLKSGRPQILFEGHIFWSLLKKKGVTLDKLHELNFKYPSIIYPKWVKDHYKGGELEYLRLEAAKKIDEELALQSTSWGMFQIMGFNYPHCGCKNVFEFVKRMEKSHEEQLRAGYNFMFNTGCAKYLKEKDWVNFAKKYNGPAYAKNGYDQKLRNAYENFKDKL